MEFFAYALVIAGGWFFLSKIYDGFKAGVSGDDGKKHCMTCGVEAIPKTHTKGTFAVELIL